MSGAAAAGGAPTEKSPLLSSSASPSVRHNRTASNESSGAEDEPPDPSPQMSLARGSILSSVVNLCTATLGAGCLALPWAMAQCGLLLGLLMLFAAGVSSNWTIRLLVRLYATDQHTSFESLALRSFGQAGAMVTHFTVLLFCFGAAVASVMVVGDVLEPVCKLLLPDVHFLHHKTTIVVLLTLCIMLPLSFFTHISSMRVMSLVSTAGVLVLALVMLLRGGEALFTGRLQSIQLARFDSGILLALPVIMFAYACHTNVFTILEEQLDQRRETDFRMVNVAVGVETFVYVAIGACGYALYGEGVDGNVLRNLDFEHPLHVLAQTALGISLCLSYPLCIYPARYTLMDMMFPNDMVVEEPAALEAGSVAAAAAAGKLPPHGHTPCGPHTILLTLFLVLASLIFAILVPSISELFTLLGSTTGALIAFILPTAIYLRLGQHGEKQRVRRHLCVVMLVIASLLAVATTVRSLIFIAETKAHDLRQSPESAHINKPETPTASATQIAS